MNSIHLQVSPRGQQNGSAYTNLDSFGPVMSSGFDFTPLFEDAVLGILPSALLLLALPYRIMTLQRQRPKVAKGGMLSDNKHAFLVVFALMQLTLLIMFILNSSLRTRATIPAAALVFACSIGICVLSHLEHARSVRPSPLINFYLLLTLPFDVARTRTLFLADASKPLAGAFAGMLGVKILVLLAEAAEKRGILLEPYRGLSPEETSGLYSRSFFFWLNKLMTSGFSRQLTNNDLYPIDHHMSSVRLKAEMKRSWDASAAPRGRPRTLFWAMLWANRGALSYCLVPRLLQIAFRYAQPFLLTRTISFASDTSQPDSIGWGLTGAFFLVFLGLAVSNGFYYHMVYRFVTSVRGGLVSIIYAKTVDLSITALDESVAITLMSSDTQSVCMGMETFNDLWAVPLELVVALYLLSRQLGIAFVAPVVIAVISTVCITGIAKFMGSAQMIWMEGIQTRVDNTATMLSSMKSVKMLGFSARLGELIQGLRVAELQLSVKFRRLLLVRVFLANSLETIAPFITFGVFALRARSTGTALSSETAYTALTLLSLVSWPVNDMIRAVPALNAAMASLSRIQTFLESDARRDHRLPLDKSPSDSFDDLTYQEGIKLTSKVPKASSSLSRQIIVAQNVSFAWTSDDSPVVRDVSFELFRGQVCLVIGPVGCGKSTLLKGILGETPSTKGFLYTDCPEVAYVDQTPWIRNKSFRDNILGVSLYEEAWYREVVRACALDQDIAVLPNGHLTKVGSAGISLSGGQKQRLALARAVYSRKDIIILDDTFSGLDAGTEEIIFNRLFSRQGLFRKMGTTVLMVTHAVHRLGYADHIIALSKGGSIAEQGTLSQLEAAGGYVAMLETKQLGESDQEKDSYAEHDANTDTALPELGAEATDIGAAEEDLNRRSGDLSLYAYYFGSVHWSSTVLWSSLFVLFGVASKLTGLLVNFWTAETPTKGTSVDGFYLALYAMLALLATTGLIGGAWHYILSFSPKGARVLHERLLKSVMNAPLSFFTSVDVGTTTNRFSQDMTLIDNDLPYAVTDFTLSLASGFMSAVLMCLSAGYFAATMPLVLLLMWVLQKFYLRTSRQMRLLDLEAKSPLFSQFIESLSGLVTIRAFGWASAFEEQNIKLLDISQKPYYLLFCIQRWLELVLDLSVTGLAVVLMVLVVKLRSEIGSGYVGLAILNVITFSQTLSNVIRNWTQVETSVGAVARVRSFVATTANENLPEEIEPLPSGTIRASSGHITSWPFQGAIELHNVSASYKPNDTSNMVLRNVSLSIRAGEKVGICGRSGSGKSSLLATVFRMLEVTPDSSITIDGVDIIRASRQDVRAALNAIPQEPFFTSGSVRVNADPSGIKADDEVVTALQCVELFDIIQAKGGLDAELDAEFFSHGQRQLFCLARAILRCSGGGRVVVLDEVTSSVDVKSDALMQRLIREHFADCTILAVAHRLETILDFDRIALMKDGELAEFDTPKALLSRNSAFKELYESTAGA